MLPSFPTHPASPPMLHAHKLSIENDPDDDGFFMITLWTHPDAPGYIALCRDQQGDAPERIWFEWEDQITGRYVDALRFTLADDLLTITIADPRACALPWPDEVARRFDMSWLRDGAFTLDVSAFDAQEITSVLTRIQGDIQHPV